MSAEPNYRQLTTSSSPQGKKLNRILDLIMNLSVGNISSAEYKRRTSLNEISHLCYAEDKTSNNVFYINPVGRNNLDVFSDVPDDIRSMEIDPREGRWLLVTFEHSNAAIYNVSNDVSTFEPQVKLRDTCNSFKDKNTIPHSVHWLWDGSIFTIGSRLAVNFWDSNTCKLVETKMFPTPVLNHVMFANKHSRNKYVAVTGDNGHVYMVDMRHGIISLTMQNHVEQSAVRAIHWNPNNELQYITGNDNGNVCLWDIRVRNKCICKFNNNDSFAGAQSHSEPLIGVKFYNNGKKIISVDYGGSIKTWDFDTGLKYSNFYEPVSLSAMNTSSIHSYQFATTDNLNQEIVFLPSDNGLRMFDIDSGKHLRHSNDICLSINCVSYDPLNMCVYGGCGDLIKVWKPDRSVIEI